MPHPEASPKISSLLRSSEWALVLAILLAVIATAVADANHSYWFEPFESIRDIARNTALLGIFALGATVVIIAGGIDLSAGSMIALSGTTCATTMLALAPLQMMGMKPVGPLIVIIACIASLLVGFLVGTLHTDSSAPLHRHPRHAGGPAQLCQSALRKQHGCPYSYKKCADQCLRSTL